jgi:hypothetical protein
MEILKQVCNIAVEYSGAHNNLQQPAPENATVPASDLCNIVYWMVLNFKLYSLSLSIMFLAVVVENCIWLFACQVVFLIATFIYSHVRYLFIQQYLNNICSNAAKKRRGR